MLFIDSREPLLLKKLAGRVATKTQVIALDSGDYMMLDKDGCSLAIERKTWGDLLGSITDGRLFAQLERMDQQYHYSVLMIEGKMELMAGNMVVGNIRSKYTHAFVQMTLFSLQRELDVAVLQTRGLPQSIDLIRVIYERGQKECYGVKTRKGQDKKRATIRVASADRPIGG